MQTDTEIRFIHIRATDGTGVPQNTGGATIAYEVRDGDINLHVARCHEAYDHFNYEKGRLAAAGRLAKHGPFDVIPDAHPRTEQIVQWFANNFFQVPIVVRKQGRFWVSTFDPATANEAV